MIVNRRTFQVKPGKTQAALDMIKAEVATVQLPHSFRLYSSNIGRLHIVGYEIEFDNFSQYESFWNEWSERETTPAFMEWWYELAMPDALNEVWNLETVTA